MGRPYAVAARVYDGVLVVSDLDREEAFAQAEPNAFNRIALGRIQMIFHSCANYRHAGICPTTVCQISVQPEAWVASGMTRITTQRRSPARPA